jgi:hypothetical protein
MQLEFLIAPLVILALMAAIVLGLALYRKVVARQQDLHIHVSANEAGSVERQSELAYRLGWIDKWGKTFTVITILYFFVLLGIVLYREWLRSSATISIN